MRSTILAVLLGSFGFGQSLLEHSAAAAGGSVGGVAGKKVSDGLTSIFQKIDQQTAKAAKTGGAAKGSDQSSPLLEVGPGVPKQKASVPPPPPPLHHAAPVHRAPLPMARVVPVADLTPQVQAPEIVQVTANELRTLTAGMSRSEVLKIGTPAARITMFDDGHLVEIYRYQNHDDSLGVVRLTDGSVSSVQVR